MRVGLVSIIGDRTCDRVTGLWPEILEKLGKSARARSYPKRNRQFLILDCIEIKVVLFLNISQAVNMTLDPYCKLIEKYDRTLYPRSEALIGLHQRFIKKLKSDRPLTLPQT